MRGPYFYFARLETSTEWRSPRRGTGRPGAAVFVSTRREAPRQVFPPIGGKRNATRSRLLGHRGPNKGIASGGTEATSPILRSRPSFLNYPFPTSPSLRPLPSHFLLQKARQHRKSLHYFKNYALALHTFLNLLIRPNEAFSRLCRDTHGTSHSLCLMAPHPMMTSVSTGTA